MAYQDLRGFLKRLEEVEGELVRITEELSPRLEMSAVLKRAGAGEGPVVLFEKVAGYPGVSVVGNVLGTRRRLAVALGVSIEVLEEEYIKRRQNLIPPEVVDGGPVKEVAIRRNVDLLKTVPVLVHHEKDAGPYISAGVVIAKDPETGVRSCGIHRLQIKGRDKMGVLLANPPLADYFAKAEAAGKPLDVAVAVGVDPYILTASVARGGPGMDKLALAGGLKGEAIKLVKGETVDVEVPASAEYVIEGRVLPHIREEEGPFGESTGYYLTFSNPVIQVTAITSRKNPIFQAIDPWGMEADTLILVGYGAEMFRELRELIPGVKAFHLVPGTCASHAIIALDEMGRSQARRALLLALTLYPPLKKVVAVDTDVNIYDPKEVEWAVATRFQASRDLILLQNLQGLGIDPSLIDGKTSKMGLDATTKPGGPAGKFDKIAVPEEMDKKAKELLRKYLRA